MFDRSEPNWDIMDTPDKINSFLQPKSNLFHTNSSDCNCNESQKTCSKHKTVTNNDKNNVSVLKCHVDSTVRKYTVKPPLFPKPDITTLKISPYKVKHQFPSVNSTQIKQIENPVNLAKNQIESCVLDKSDNNTIHEELKSDSDVNLNISQLEVPSVVNSILENNIIDSENNNKKSINNKCTEIDFKYRDNNLLNEYEIFDGNIDMSIDHLDDINTTTEDEKSSIASDTIDQSYSVRKKLINWFGSFGKGKNVKQKKHDHFYKDGNSDKDNNDSDSHSSLDEKPNMKVKYDNLLSIDDIKIEEIPTKSKSLRIVEELILTEKVFIDVLNLICKTFVSFVEQAGYDTKVIPSTDLLKIINPLPQLLSLNEDLLQDMEKRLEHWNEHPKIADVIVKKGPFLKLYSTYIQNFEHQCNLLDDYCQKYSRFQKCVKDFEACDVCKKLTIKHYMLKPIQRIPQYRLLLENYLKHQDESSIDYEDTIVALNIVCDVANHANKSMKHGDCLSKLLQLQSQLGNYVIIKPGRELVKEGELFKLSRKDMQLRYFILLNDCLLYTSYYGTVSGLKVNYELPLSGMKVFLPITDDYNNEFSIISMTRSFTLRAKSSVEREEWVNILGKTISEHNNKQLSFLNMKFIPKDGREPFILGHEAPIWIQDCRVTMCQSCAAEFTVTFRRHHCRACGKVVCSNCSENKAPLRYMKFQAARVCDDCYDYLLKEFDEKMLEIEQAHNISDVDLLKMVDTIKSSFKKSGLWSSKKLAKYVPKRLKEVTANDSGPQMSGWLYRREKRKSWKRYWFVLKEQVLYVYRASEDVVALNTIPVLGYSVQTFPEGTSYEDFDSSCVFQLAHAGQNPLIFGANIEVLAKRWINALTVETKLK